MAYNEPIQPNAHLNSVVAELSAQREKIQGEVDAAQGGVDAAQEDVAAAGIRLREQKKRHCEALAHRRAHDQVAEKVIANPGRPWPG